MTTTFSPLHTDFYQLLMAQGYFKAGIHMREAVFHLFFRRRPFGGGFAICAGLETALHFIEQFRFKEEDIQYLASLSPDGKHPYFDREFLTFLRDVRLDVTLDAMVEGSVAFPFEPLIRVRGPLLICQLLESPLLNYINFATLIATKAARVRIAAGDDPVMEFGLRRAQGPDGALTASRAAFIGGVDSTSNVLAGKIYGIPLRGTQAHSWVMAFDDEEEAFFSYGQSNPHNSIFLVDTYDSIVGVKKAIQAAKRLEKDGVPFLGIRLDSGDLAHLSIEARALLDEAGFSQAKIYASNELDETVIAELKRQGAQISVWGVGTHLVTSYNQPFLDGVYKMSAIANEKGELTDKIKLSEQLIKVSSPGVLQVRRFKKEGEYGVDMIYDLNHPPSKEPVIIDPLDATRVKKISSHLEYVDLLTPILKEGERVYTLPSLREIQDHAKKELAHFHRGIKRFLNPHQYLVGMEEGLFERKNRQVRKIRG